MMSQSPCGDYTLIRRYAKWRRRHGVELDKGLSPLVGIIPL